ncbi:MAG: radical SAM protein, partial [Bacteroidetes bacterium]|nr:radical SAM protein [Bacteroidota bacterium]
EPDEHGRLQRVNTIFLTGKECAFKCLMCDLWKNTLNGPTPKGAIIKQLDYALSRLPAADVIKLYNSSNFFDPKAVPPEDYPGIIERVKSYKRVVVENHPNLCGEGCVEFGRQLDGKLEIAMGLETIHPHVLSLLNKQMTTGDFAKASSFLVSHHIDVRAFILLNPPHLTDRDENIKWAVAAIDFAFENGATCCSVISTRPGNGVMELLQQEDKYTPPSLDMLEEVFEQALSLKKGRVFADTWDIGFLSLCPSCFDARKARLDAMNLDQTIHPKIICNCHPVYA